MKRFPVLAMLALGACASRPPIVHVEQAHPFYGALGHDPGWMLMIGDDTAGMRVMRQDGGYDDLRFARTLSRVTEGVRTWRMAGAGHSLTVEARPARCQGSRIAFEDTVRVTLDGRVLDGCGGRALRGEER